MRIIILLTYLLLTASCGKSKVQECIDSKVSQGWSYSDAKSECESGYADSKIRR